MSGTTHALGERFFAGGIEMAAARALAADFARRPGPKHVIVIATSADSTAVVAAVDALTPDDRLTVVAGPATDAVDDGLSRAGAWVEQRARAVATLDDADPADTIIFADLIHGDGGDLFNVLENVAKHLAPGGVVNLAVPAASFLAGAAADDVARIAADHGIGSDLVLRNAPPVRVHRLRFTDAPTGLADDWTPMERTSSVRITSDMNLDSNGVAAAALCLGAAALAKRALPNSRFWLLPTLAAAPVAAFFRDPARCVPDDPHAVLAASDGKVLEVGQVRDERLGDDEYLRIAVFLSVLDVHVNRAPVAGRVTEQFVVDGGFAAAMKPDAEHNVAAYTVLDTSHGMVAVAQRTGLIARRIVHRAPVGAMLAKGERFGLIRFGSRTDIYLPVHTAIPCVGPGERVIGGETVVARWKR